MAKDEIVSFVMGMGAAAGTTTATMLTQAAAGLTQPDISTFTVAFIGASLSTLVAATIAALLAMGVSKPIQPRSAMWLYFVISAGLGATFAVVVTTAPFLKPYFGGVHPTPLAFLASFPARWLIPVIIEETPKRVRKLISGSDVKDGEA